MKQRISRRSFMRQTSAGVAGAFAAPAILSARSPNDVVRIAAVGVGGKGWTDITAAAPYGNVVAFCDVDAGSGAADKRRGGFAAAAEEWPEARKYSDWRKLLDAEAGKVDAITISTPDHMHAPVTMSAMQRGMAVYTQKPLTRTVHEARALTEAAKKYAVSTQMGNQGHSGLGYRTTVAVIQSGAIGKVKEAHAWSNRPIWPQGLERPAGSDPVPSNLDWDLWLGVAPERPYKKDVYHPFKWRGWYDFGAGALGDMGCHIIDPVVWALELGPARSVVYEGPTPLPETFPAWEILKYRFPGTKHTAGDISMTWYDGKKLPKAEGTHLPGDNVIPTNGAMFVGTEGTLLCEHGKAPRLFPEEKFKDFPMPKLDEMNHYQVWIDGVKTGAHPNSHFGYAGPLTETVLLGVIASRVGPVNLEWDSANLKFTNSAAANQFVRAEYRKGWEVEGL